MDLEYWAVRAMSAYFRRLVGNRGLYVAREDWDNLIILDACRYDMFEQICDVPGALKPIISRGSRTSEFLLENFRDGPFGDTVYVTGMPTLAELTNQGRLPGNLFYRTISVCLEGGWNQPYGTVLPQTMLDYALQANGEYPHKRLIVHFVQPHAPFIGEEGSSELKHGGVGKGVALALGSADSYDDLPHIWHLLKHGRVSEEAVWRGYRQNLEAVLPYVETLLEELAGRTVITSDHGNLVGERILPLPIVKLYGHGWAGLYTKNLVTVPWLVIEKNPRKEVVEEETNAPYSVHSEEVVAQRLRDLGYL